MSCVTFCLRIRAIMWRCLVRRAPCGGDPLLLVHAIDGSGELIKSKSAQGENAARTLYPTK